jgi:ATP-dependent Lon protease
MAELGLFPLPLVLLPTERVPLHIFEPRYRELIAECIETGGEFGFVLGTGDGAVHEIGTRAAIAEVLAALDERMNILAEGRERFRLLELTSGRSFATGLVEPVEDENDPFDQTDADRALDLFQQLAEATGSTVELPDPESEQLDFELGARVDFDVAAKQELLATTSPRKRMSRLVELLETALESTFVERTVRERASGTGRVTPLDRGE